MKRRLDIPAYLLALFMLGGGGGLNAQDRATLEQRKREAQKEIEYTTKLIEETTKSRKTTLQRVRMLSTRMQLRNQLINSMEQEIGIIEQEIKGKNELISALQKDLEKVRDAYAELVIQTYWNRDQRKRLMFILSAADFNQAYRRLKYLQQYTRHRKQQALMIRSMKDLIGGEIEMLEQKRLEKERAISAKQNEYRKLGRERRSKQALVSDLSQREKELRAELAEKRDIADRLEKEIRAIIEAETRKNAKANLYEQLTPAERLIADNFQGNRGSLPWPTERGIITGRFGRHQHPVLKQVMEENDGIDIRTVEGASARAIFDGVVSQVVVIPGRNYTILVKHGNYFSVYHNLIDLNVKKGDPIKAKQPLGTIYTNEETNETILHIQIWRGTTKQNPEEWLSRVSS